MEGGSIVTRASLVSLGYCEPVLDTCTAGNGKTLEIWAAKVQEQKIGNRKRTGWLSDMMLGHLSGFVDLGR